MFGQSSFLDFGFCNATNPSALNSGSKGSAEPSTDLGFLKELFSEVIVWLPA